MSGRISSTGAYASSFFLSMNGGTTTGSLQAAGYDAARDNQFQSGGYLPYFTNNGANAANFFSIDEIYIGNYSSASTMKPISAYLNTTNDNGATTTYAATTFFAGFLNNTSAITQLDINANAGNWVTDSNFWLYGIKNS